MRRDNGRRTGHSDKKYTQSLERVKCMKVTLSKRETFN